MSELQNYRQRLEALKASGNFRSIPADHNPQVVDLSGNDYLGIAADVNWRHQLLKYAYELNLPLSSSASRLLSAHQRGYAALERLLSDLYGGRSCLLFNSGYHANTGLVSALAGRDSLILADKLVHASIIDGITLSRAKCLRFRHNDFDHLDSLLAAHGKDYSHVLIVAESVYSMDGDCANLERLVAAKRRHPGAMIYLDEAHAFGACGRNGLGLWGDSDVADEIDVVVGTFGKALASVGAFAAMSPTIAEYAVNHARSFIFSTALPPVCVTWTRLLVEKMVDMDDRRQRLAELGRRMQQMLHSPVSGHIQPLIVGDAARAVALSEQLLAHGFKVLPIRTPTVPPGTERLRFSLSAAIKDEQLNRLDQVLKTIIK